MKIGPTKYEGYSCSGCDNLIIKENGNAHCNGKEIDKSLNTPLWCIIQTMKRESVCVL